ncbi:hypothetical protein EC973_002491 [Apophysomyces ossiformis]|uniref:Anaphase-promoting complex subunit 4-like WD40 domain-containing protein n=1 Tax=Apophysomyces ossiformis TaxID=679940 RepID=A0A8H7BU40_9FUNG|nr:hypothetical protein EC973_002491 [Apophysomyces ossiformis]
MNLELLDPWEQEYPQIIENTLEDGYVLNCKFNRRGTLLAAGCLDGRCVVWDFDTKGVARDLAGHVKPVASISGTKHTKIRFDTALVMAQMHPTNNFRFVAALSHDNPVIVDIIDGDIKKTPLPTENDDQKTEKTPSSNVTAIAWNKTGNMIYTGTSRGYLNIINAETCQIIHSTRITTTTIKGIQWSRNGKYVEHYQRYDVILMSMPIDLLINANDRLIRLYRLTDYDGIPTLQNKFQDLVNRVQWNQVCFSGDGEFVIGGSGHKAEHNIYIWDKKLGNLVKILEGPKEPLDDLAWHPVRPVIGSVSSYGNIYIWTTKQEENWSAFAPDFTELEENLEYDEKEDEFDIVPEEEVSKRKYGDEDTIVDVTTCESIQAYLDLDEQEGEDEVFYLPTLPFRPSRRMHDDMEDKPKKNQVKANNSNGV